MASGNSMFGATPSIPFESEEVSTFFNPTSSFSAASCKTTIPKILPPLCLSPPPVTADFFRSDDLNRFAHHFGLDYPLNLGKPGASADAAVDSSSSFDFSDPYAFVPAHTKDCTENELFLAGLEDSDAKNFSREHRMSPEKKSGGIICSVEKSAEDSELPPKPVPARTSSKRNRAVEVHNLSEKRRRNRINEKMKALQNLVPNSNKTDKASMLDDAIEYLKRLQLQVQMLTMRNGLSLHPMCLPGGLQTMISPQTGLNFDEGNGFHNSTSGIASSTNAESLVQPAISFSIPNHSAVIPSMTNIATSDTSSGFQPYVKDALCGSMPRLVLDTTKIGQTPSPDLS